MDEKRSLIQQTDLKPWYKRRAIIVVGVVCAVLVFVTIVVTVATVAAVVPGNSKCTYDNAYDCVDGGRWCLWCYNSDGTGQCKEPYNDPTTSQWPLTCSEQINFMCNAYGFATNQDQASCESFTPHGCPQPCHWSNPTGNCYSDSGLGPIGCCFNSANCIGPTDH